MILIADSGATKTDWRMIDHEGQIQQARTQGFNPYYQGYDEIRDEIHNELLGQVGQSKIYNIYYYGAGCITLQDCSVISNALKYSFPDAEIEVNHDLLGAARGLCGHEEGIACILGTGSNSCLFDGENIVENVPALGFILGDEGSGAYMGKTLLADFIRKSMPEEIRLKMEASFHLDRNSIIDKVYNQERPSRYVAGFSKFIFQNIKHPYIHKLVFQGFLDFFDSNICRYRNFQNIPVHFSGGVAFYFNDILREVAGEKGVTVKNIVENPISGLTLYHKSD